MKNRYYSAMHLGFTQLTLLAAASRLSLLITYHSRLAELLPKVLKIFLNVLDDFREWYIMKWYCKRILTKLKYNRLSHL